MAVGGICNALRRVFPWIAFGGSIAVMGFAKGSQNYYYYTEEVRVAFSTADRCAWYLEHIGYAWSTGP